MSSALGIALLLIHLLPATGHEHAVGPASALASGPPSSLFAAAPALASGGFGDGGPGLGDGLADGRPIEGHSRPPSVTRARPDDFLPGGAQPSRATGPGSQGDLGTRAVFAVNSTSDTVDANPGNGVCADATGACTLRLAATKDGAGRLRVTLTANGTNNVIDRIAITRNDNGVLSPPAPPIGAHQSVIFLTRTNANAATTVALTVTDRCGDFKTFVGGGRNAF